MLKATLLRLVILVGGLTLFTVFYRSLTEALSLVRPEASLYFTLMLITTLITGFLVELAPFNKKISLNNRQSLLLAAVLGLAIVLTNPYWFFGGRIISIEYGVPLLRLNAWWL